MELFKLTDNSDLSISKTNIFDLPKNVIIYLLGNLSIPGFLKMRRVCKFFKFMLDDYKKIVDFLEEKPAICAQTKLSSKLISVFIRFVNMFGVNNLNVNIICRKYKISHELSDSDALIADIFLHKVTTLSAENMWFSPSITTRLFDAIAQSTNLSLYLNVIEHCKKKLTYYVAKYDNAEFAKYIADYDLIKHAIKYESVKCLKVCPYKDVVPKIAEKDNVNLLIDLYDPEFGKLTLDYCIEYDAKSCFEWFITNQFDVVEQNLNESVQNCFYCDAVQVLETLIHFELDVVSCYEEDLCGECSFDCYKILVENCNLPISNSAIKKIAKYGELVDIVWTTNQLPDAYQFLILAWRHTVSRPNDEVAAWIKKNYGEILRNMK